ncbi:MAG: hypothetical protein VX938_14015, partial [Myxococcota bacterium]|nr:hypothetical protein [Myxococcota bacterium]
QVKWSPPHLAMLQIDGDQNLVIIADLQEYIYSDKLTDDDMLAEDYPEAGQTGLDLNGDGDYVDEGEELPLPPVDSFLFHGWVRSHMLHDTNQAILDYHYDASRQFLGIVTNGGNQFMPGTGLATGPAVQPSYRTLVYQGLEGEALLPFESTNHPLGEGVIPKRMFVYMGAVVGQGETLSVRDLVFVGLKGYGDTPARLLALDITDPLSVQTLADITIDPSHGSVQSILVDDAGLVRVQATHDLIMIDPSKLDAKVEDDESHPAIAGVLPGAGTGQYTFTAAGHGMSVVAHASKTYITQTAPTLQFVRFPESVDVVDPTTLAGDSDALTSAKDLMSTVASLVPARYEEVDDVAVSSLSPPNPLNHYHVLVHAPGGAGETLDLALESLDRVRAPISPKGFRFAPTRAMSDTVHSALGAATDDCVAPVRSLKAWRLSSDPTAEDYNRYLSRPF